MLISTEEFNVIQETIKHVIAASQIVSRDKLEKYTTSIEMGRVFDPGTGLRYVLFYIKEESSIPYLYFKNLPASYGIDVGGEPDTKVDNLDNVKQSQVSIYYEKYILPQSIKDLLMKFYDENIHQAPQDVKECSVLKSSFRAEVLLPIFDRFVALFQEAIDKGENLYSRDGAHAMARYTFTGLLLNTLALLPVSREHRIILNQEISEYLKEKLDEDFKKQDEQRMSGSPSLERRLSELPFARGRVTTNGSSASFSSSSCPSYSRSQVIVKVPTNGNLTDVNSGTSLSHNRAVSAINYQSVFNRIQREYLHHHKYYNHARKKRVVSFLRDAVNIKKSVLTQWFFSLCGRLAFSNNAEESVKFILDSYNKLSPTEKQRINTHTRYNGISCFFKVLDEVNYKINPVASSSCTSVSTFTPLQR